MRASVDALLARLPGEVSPAWPDGERFIRAFAHGTMSVEVYAPRAHDPQSPHAQDELYFVHAGQGDFVCAGVSHRFRPGDAFFVPAGVAHRFENFSDDFVTWVVFWGPSGGESGPG